MDKPKSHGLGFGNGSIIEYPDGTVEYRQAGKLIPAFRLRVAEVTGVTTRKATSADRKKLDAKGLGMVVSIQGAGTTLAEVAAHYGTGEKIEAWFLAHPDFGANRPSPAAIAPTPNLASATSVADELTKLAALRDSGVLNAEEFAAQKAKLLG